jgi:hypothetical protein
VSRIMPFQKAPINVVFKVVKERGRPAPEPGLWVKTSNSRSRAYSKSKQIILALGDLVEVISFKPTLG